VCSISPTGLVRSGLRKFWENVNRGFEAYTTELYWKWILETKEGVPVKNVREFQRKAGSFNEM